MQVRLLILDTLTSHLFTQNISIHSEKQQHEVPVSCSNDSITHLPNMFYLGSESETGVLSFPNVIIGNKDNAAQKEPPVTAL